MPFEKIKNVIAVAAGKGGVGKSSVATNLALALSRQGRKVGLMDTDLYGPSLRKLLPEDRLPSQGAHSVEPALAQGIKTMSMAYFQSDLTASAIRAPIANRMITQFIKQTDWGELDDLIIDFPPGTGDIQLTICQQIPITAALMVTTPQSLAVADVKKAINLFDRMKVPILGIIENMAYFLHEASKEKIFLFGKGGGESLAREVGAPFLGQLPIDADFSRYCDAGQILFDQKPDSILSKAFVQLANDLTVHLNELKTQSGKRLESFEITWKEMSHAN